MSQYHYSIQNDKIRVDISNDRHNLAWAFFDRSGNPVEFSKESFIMHWNHDDDKMISETIKSFVRAPFNCSVYGARYDLISGEYKISGSGLEGAMIAYTIKGAPIYFVTGEEVGKGSDGEPLLENAKVLSRAIATGEGGYVIK